MRLDGEFSLALEAFTERVLMRISQCGKEYLNENTLSSEMCTGKSMQCIVIRKWRSHEC